MVLVLLKKHYTVFGPAIALLCRPGDRLVMSSIALGKSVNPFENIVLYDRDVILVGIHQIHGYLL